MDCFKTKLMLRTNQQRRRQKYPPVIFEHLSICRSCWTYANYLWHREAQEMARKHGLESEGYETRLESAWASRHGWSLPGFTRVPEVLRHQPAHSER
jgi:hypothetical protein